MAYKKTTWVNDQTKLSAKNLNKIETGIADAHDEIATNAEAIETKQDKLIWEDNAESQSTIKTIGGISLEGPGNIEFPSTGVISLKLGDGLTGSTTTITSEGTIAVDFDKVASQSDLSTLAATVTTGLANLDTKKQDQLISGENIKTIYGTDLLGEGNIVFDKYEECDNIELKSKTSNGVYKVTNAKDDNLPDYISKDNGLLEVLELADGTRRQQWWSEKGFAARLLGSGTVQTFYINEELQQQGEISLEAGKEYVLRGTLIGNIKITGDTDAYTKIVLNGADIRSEKDYAIYIEAENSKVIVELRSDTSNYLYVDDNVTEEELSSMAALYAEADLTVGGTGYLMCYHSKGHGIKGTDVRFTSIPHIHIESLHDAVHGKSIKVCNGYFYIKNAKDAFSAGKPDEDETAGHTGAIDIASGTIEIEKCSENAFQARYSALEGGNTRIRIYGESKLIFKADFSTESAFNAENNGIVKIYETVKIDNKSSQEMPAVTNMAEDFGEAVVSLNGTTIEAVDNVYTLDTDEVSYVVSGDLSDKKIVITGKKVDLAFGNVYYKDTSTDTGAFIEYQNSGKRLEFKLAEDSISYIYKNNGYAIKSAKNLVINTADGTADIFIQCPNGYGIYAPDGDTLIVNDGLRAIYNCSTGIKGCYVFLGDEGASAEDLTKKKCTDIYIRNCTANCIELSDRASSSSTTIYYGMLEETANDYGCSVIDNVAVTGEYTELASIKADKAVVTPEETAFTYTPMLYVKQTSIEDCTNVYKYTLPRDYDSEFPTISSGTTTDWVVVPKAYTKSEVDTQVDTINNRIDEADARLDDLNSDQIAINHDLEDHLAKYLYGDDENYATVKFTADDGMNPIVVRGNEGLITDPVYIEDNTTYSINKDTGEYCEADGDNAQVNIIVDIPDGKTLTVAATPKNYKKCESEDYTDETGAVVDGKQRVKATKVSGNFTITMTLQDIE